MSMYGRLYTYPIYIGMKMTVLGRDVMRYDRESPLSRKHWGIARHHENERREEKAKYRKSKS